MRYVKVKNSDTINSGRDDSRFYLPRNFNKKKYGNLRWCKLEEIADISSSSLTASRFPNKVFNYFDLQDVDEVEGEITKFRQIKGRDIKGGKRLLQSNDVIFARIEPSIFNRKYAVVPEEIKECLTSTEFLVARPKDGSCSFYIHWALRGPWIAEQLDPGILTGSTGRRRLSKEDFKELLIPKSSIKDQLVFGDLILKKRAERRVLLERADQAITDLDEEIMKYLFEIEIK